MTGRPQNFIRKISGVLKDHQPRGAHAQRNSSVELAGVIIVKGYFSAVLVGLLLIVGFIGGCRANVITEWDAAEAAAASAAGTALALLHPQAASDFKSALAQYLKGISGPAAATAAGIRLGEAVAQRLVESRAMDGATDADSYRPKTRPAHYVPTATMLQPVTRTAAR